MMPGGRERKSPKKVEQSDQSTTNKNSLEVDVVFEIFDRCSLDGNRRVERGNDGGDVGDGRRKDVGNVDEVKKQLPGEDGQ